MQRRHRRGDGRRRGRLRDLRRRRPTTATAAGRCRRASPTSPSCDALLEPLRDADKGVVALLPGEKVTHDDVFDAAARDRPPAHVDRAAHGQGLSRGTRRSWRRNDAARAEGVEVWPQVSCRPLDVPDEPARAVHVQHARRVPGADGPARRGAHRARTAIRRGGRGRGTSCRASAGALPVNFDALVGRRVATRTPSSSAARSSTSPTERGVHAARRHARHLARGEPRDPVHERARQQRSRGDRVAAPAGHGAARAGRLRRARQPAVRRVLRDRPARQLGARQGGHAARARDPQAHRRAGRGVRPRTTAARSRSARPPTSSCSTSTPSPPARCAASATSPPTASGSSPTGPTA